ncbi:putative ABC transporter permease protein YufP [Halolactibacillus miurensis]|uniref:ABC transporter permease protein YufP n=1 Tax=Halolactibacillus miurensis TaxID=306541 RepID=A0A1I6QGM6_9BACI|nr:ABC transporter permease [Halolactibacillus miurensis]GEM03378.1 putative ABC transporter permease protein YufP [Halolactibacillus miurensis]SFS51617.1 simple sugar transport system permease protein [Halolactibacillus miurensis]
MMENKKLNILIPILSVLLGFLVGAIVMLAFGYNPIEGYAALFQGAFGSMYNIGESIRRTIPLVLSGLAIAFAFRSGLFNIGAEGQVFVGWFAAVWVGVAFDLPAIIHIPLAILAAAVAGALWAFVPGILKATRGVHEVVVTIMMNYIALHTTNYLIRTLLSDGGSQSERIANSAWLATPGLQEMFGYSQIHWGFIVSIIFAVFVWFFLEKTTYGYELRAVGFNPHAAKYSGMSVKRNIVLAMLISGGLAGIGGAMEGIGTFGYMYTHGAFTNLGFDGIAVALLGANTAPGVVLAAFLFGALKVGALSMPPLSGVPAELVEIVIAMIIFFVAASYMIRLVIMRFKKEEN